MSNLIKNPRSFEQKEASLTPHVGIYVEINKVVQDFSIRNKKSGFDHVGSNEAVWFAHDDLELDLFLLNGLLISLPPFLPISVSKKKIWLIHLLPIIQQKEDR